jgi:hypothetical protein
LAEKFDAQDVAAQIDVLRKHLRAWYAMHGPVPAELVESLDMGFPAREAERLKAAADLADQHAAALREIEARRAEQQSTPAPSAADQAEAHAKSLRAQAETYASSVSTQKWPEGMPPKGGSNRDPNAPRPTQAAMDKAEAQRVADGRPRS